MALANVAVLLAHWGKKVLVVDWDLEAPGVEHFFFEDPELSGIQNRPGLIEMLTRAATQPVESDSIAWRNLLTEVHTKNGVVFQLLTAGARSSGYFKHVRELDLKSFYENQDGGYIIENLRKYWKESFDFILIDSRTGITDIGGICTIQLPDILALVFTATKQSLVGAVDVAAKASIERQKLPFDRAQVTVLPLPSKFDTQTEHEIAKQWLGHFETALNPSYKPWLPKDVDRRHFLEVTKIPYTPYFSFGEKLPVIEQGTTDPSGLGFAYETIAALIANHLQQPNLVLSNRDEYTRLARSPNPLVQTLPRPLTESSLLYVGLSGSRLLANLTDDRNPVTREGLLIRFHKVVADSANEQRGSVVRATEDGALLAFAQPHEALSCALSIQERLAISTPIISSIGPLRARMGIHATGDGDQPEQAESLVTIVVGISNKAPEGQIVVSERVRDSIPPTMSVRFKAREDQLEFISDDAVFEQPLFDVVGVMIITVTEDERAALFVEPEATKHRGGFQAFLVGLQSRVEPETNRLELTITDRERIARYAHDYRSGGWQGRLRKIFGRTLGPNLGRLQSHKSR